MTVRGLDGNPALEGNPLLRALMQAHGIESVLVWWKILIGSIGAAVAAVCEPAIARQDPWVFKLTVFESTKAWLRSGDRSWIAYLPLYGIAAFQLLAALSWAALGRG